MQYIIDARNLKFWENYPKVVLKRNIIAVNCIVIVGPPYWTGAEIAGDVFEGKNIKQAAKERSGRAFEQFKRESIDSFKKVLRPPLSPPPKKTKKKNKRFNRKKIKSDNFGPY